MGNIFPTDEILGRDAKEKLLRQRGVSVWMTGLSGSGKTSIAVELEKQLFRMGKLTQVLDGDNVRMGINKNLGFSEKDREENIRRIAEVTKLFVNSGLITICCFVSPTRTIREQAKNIIGEEDFLEVFIDTPLEVCEMRDVKGLYAKARKGDITDFTGVSAPFEAPENADIHIYTEGHSAASCAAIIIKELIQRDLLS